MDMVAIAGIEERLLRANANRAFINMFDVDEKDGRHFAALKSGIENWFKNPVDFDDEDPDAAFLKQLVSPRIKYLRVKTNDHKDVVGYGCVCKSGDCSSQWPIHEIDAEFPGAPYVCVRGEQYPDVAGNQATFSVEVTPDARPMGPEQSHFYFECDDVDATYKTLMEKGLKFIQPPTDMSYLWREARLRDPDGHDIRIYHAGKNRLAPPWKVNT